MVSRLRRLAEHHLPYSIAKTSWEVPAGFHDAMRTRNAHPLAGRKYGGKDYALGFAVGATTQAAVRLAMKGRRA